MDLQLRLGAGERRAALRSASATSPRAWLGNPKTALPSLIVVTTWMWVGFNMVVLLAALHSLPKEVIEAAELDNCGWGSKLVFVILPLIRPTLLNLIVLSFIGKMKIFDLVWITTKGGPLWSTETVSTYVYKRAFEWTTFDLGYPSTIAAVWFVIVLGDRADADLCVPPAREAGVLRRMRGRSSAPLLLLLLVALHGVRGRAVRVGRDDVAAHHDRDHARPLRAARSRLHWEKFPHAWFNSNYNVYFTNSRDDRARGGRDPDDRRRDGGALPRALPLPAQPGASTSSDLLDHHLPAADHHHRAVPDPGAVRALQHASSG